MAGGLSRAPRPDTSRRGGGAAPPRLREALAARGLRGLAALLSRVPREQALAAAGRCGAGWARLGGPRTDVARRNLRIAFPEWSERQRRRLLERSFANLARSALEFATLPGPDARDALLALADVEGLEHLEAARRASPTGGALVLTAHLGSWELLLAVMAARGYPIAVVHRPRSNRAFDELLGEWRGRSGAVLLARGSAARGALRALREGRFLGVPLDQNCRRSEGVFVPFFGRLACTRDGPARLAMRTGVPVVPVFIERIGEGARHRVHVAAPLELASGTEDRAELVRENVARMTAAIERAIRRSPDQWTWNHRRWRVQPAGEPQPYPSRSHRFVG